MGVVISDETRSVVEGVLSRLVNRYSEPADTRPWVIAFSGGKDSTLVAHLVFETLAAVRPSARTRPVHILASDTQVETPAISQFVTDQLAALEVGAADLGYPVKCHLVRPELHET